MTRPYLEWSRQPVGCPTTRLFITRWKGQRWAVEIVGKPDYYSYAVRIKRLIRRPEDSSRVLWKPVREERRGEPKYTTREALQLAENVILTDLEKIAIEVQDDVQGSRDGT